MYNYLRAFSRPEPVSLVSDVLALLNSGQLPVSKLEEADHKRNQAKPEPK